MTSMRSMTLGGVMWGYAKMPKYMITVL